MTAPGFVLAAMTASTSIGTPFLEYADGSSGVVAPRATRPDDPCVVAEPLPDLTCYDRGDCGEPADTMLVTAACYRRNYLTCASDRRGLRTLVGAPQPVEAPTSSPWASPLLIGGSMVVMLVGGFMLGYAVSQ